MDADLYMPLSLQDLLYFLTYQQGITLGPVLYTHIFEPSSFPVSAYKLLWNLILLDLNLLVIFADKHVERKFICWDGEIGGSNM